MESSTTSLEALNGHFFGIATQALGQEETQFIESKWEQIRGYACQNAGFKKWGKHLLHLGPASHARLENSFRSLISGIEMTGFKLWKESAKDPHLEAIFRLFFDDQASVAAVDFAMEEKLALFWKYDPSIISQFRERFERIFRDLYHQMVWTQHDPLVTQMLVGNLIAIYPFFDPPSGREVNFLDCIDGQWQIIRYRCETIPLVGDKIQAHGLTPVNHPTALPMILFCGTPFPSSRGFWEAVKSDLHPFRSIGEDIFLKGKDRIDAWMKGKAHVKSYGMSLGGALGYHMGKTYGERVTIYAYGPPGLFPSLRETQKIHGAAFYHVSDFVASLGYHPTGDHFKSYGVITEAQRNFLLAHARAVGCNPTVVIEINPFHDNRTVSRHILTGFKEILSALLFIFTFPLRLIWSGYSALRNALTINR